MQTQKNTEKDIYTFFRTQEKLAVALMYLLTFYEEIVGELCP